MRVLIDIDVFAPKYVAGARFEALNSIDCPCHSRYNRRTKGELPNE